MDVPHHTGQHSHIVPQIRAKDRLLAGSSLRLLS